MTKSTKQGLIPLLDSYLLIAQEKISQNGEDSYLINISPDAAIIGVFDGCGGSGAKRYNKLGGKTGAYIASRAVAGATSDWFSEILSNEQGAFSSDDLKSRILEGLYICNNVCGEPSRMKGLLSKEFPTTLALMICQRKNNRLSLLCIWSGDSRCYLLDSKGLTQLTEDDVDGLDAMENLSSDGVLTNVVSLSKEFDLHTKIVNITNPCVVFSATDGCFGYLSTPMEFEYQLLESLLSSNSVEQWESKYKKKLDLISGDDFSLCGLIIGYGSFQNLQKSFRQRKQELYNKYIYGIEQLSHDEKLQLWAEYKVHYSRLLNG